METSWDQLKLDNQSDAKQSQAEAKQRQIDVAKAFHRCFKTESGQKVLSFLTNAYVMNNAPQKTAQNITYEAGFCNGQADVVTHIINQIQRAEIL